MSEPIINRFASEDYVSEALTKFLQARYHVGSIIIDTSNTNPATYLGFGTWEQIKDTFLLACGDTYSAGSTGGESEHVLTVNEMPKHNHNILRPRWFASESGELEGEDSIYGTESTVTDAFLDYNSVQYTGNSQAHNNMPPYLAVYVWTRIA